MRAVESPAINIERGSSLLALIDAHDKLERFLALVDVHFFEQYMMLSKKFPGRIRIFATHSCVHQNTFWSHRFAFFSFGVALRYSPVAHTRPVVPCARGYGLQSRHASPAALPRVNHLHFIIASTYYLDRTHRNGHDVYATRDLSWVVWQADFAVLIHPDCMLL